MNDWLFLLLGLYVVISVYTFRFQRTTLSISREILGRGDPDLQLVLTPNWMGVLAWSGTALLVINLVLFFIYFGWIWALGILGYGFIFGAFVDMVTPLPPYYHCFNIVERELNKRIHNLVTHGPDTKKIEKEERNYPVLSKIKRQFKEEEHISTVKQLEDLLRLVKDMRKKHKIR